MFQLNQFGINRNTESIQAVVVMAEEEEGEEEEEEEEEEDEENGRGRMEGGGMDGLLPRH